jgi:hypothetical protein
MGGSGSGSGISAAVAKKLLENGSTSTRAAGKSATEIHDPAGPIEILRLHRYSYIRQPDGTSSSSDSQPPDYGILLFLEEAKQP